METRSTEKIRPSDDLIYPNEPDLYGPDLSVSPCLRVSVKV